MMDCKSVRKQLERDVDGLEPLSSWAAAHAASCPSCSAHRQKLRALESRLARALPMTAPPEDLANRVMQAVRVDMQRMARPRWPRYAVVAALTSVLLAAWVSVGLRIVSEPDRSGVGSIIVASEGARILRGPQVLTARKGDRVQIDDLLLTAEAGLMRIRFDDGSCLHVQAGTLLQLAGAQGNRHLPACVTLHRGEVSTLVQPGRSYTVRTPFATAVVDGTQFCMATDDRETALIVRDGEATFFNQAGRVIAHAEERTTASQGAPPSSPTLTATSCRNACCPGSLPEQRCEP